MRPEKGVRMGWRGYIDTDRRTVFFWSQKAACTTLFGMLADNMAERPVHKGHFHTHSQPYRKCLAAIRGRGHRSVIVARHPATRAISAYFNKFCLYRDRPLRRRADLEVFAKDLHDLYCARRGLRTEDNVMSFEDFLHTVAHLHASRAKPGLPVNGHWETQVPPFLVEEGFRYDHVVHVERLGAEMAALADRLGMRFRPRAMNRTRTAAEGQGGYLGRIPACEVAGHPFGYGNFIDPGILERIGRIYRADFEMFGYPPAPDLSARPEGAESAPGRR